MDHSNFPINLIGDLIALRTHPQDGPIRLPDWKRCLTGTVLATGPEVQNIRRGERVSFGAAVGMDATLSGEAIRILREKDIDFVYEDSSTYRTAKQYTLADDVLPCRCEPGKPCQWHSAW